MNKSAFITGGSGGLGIALTRLLAAENWRVFAADCDDAALNELAGERNITPVVLDVTDPESVQDAFRFVGSQVDHLDAIVNFAGILRIGALIEIDEQVLQSILDINLMGTYRVNKAFFPLVNRTGKEGRIVNISSETGWHTAAPFNGPYAISKHAIEAYSDALRRELSIYNVPVICIQPGPFKTSMVSSTVDSFKQAARESTLYAPQLEHFSQLVHDANKKSHAPVKLARVIHKALTVTKPKHRYSVKADTGRSLLECLPMALADRIFRKLLSSV